MFNSPLHFCPVCHQYVALDQSQHECAHEHGCLSTQPCPLAHLFSPPEPQAASALRGDPEDLKTKTDTPSGN